MLRTGTDAYSGKLDGRGIRTTDDIIIMPLHATQWDGLSHVLFGDEMWNGYDCRSVSSFGAEKCGIEKVREKMVGRGVLLDVARMQGKPSLEDGFAITPNILETARQKYAKIQVRRGDFLLVRTGHIEAKLNSKNWDGYAGGDAPGLSFETLDWLQKRQVAAVATDTWSVEVRPNNSDEVVSPFHWISIPIMGLTLGEIFNLAELDATAPG